MEPAEFALVDVEVNGTRRTERVAVRKTLADYLRENLGLTGTHLGCEHGVCGACVVGVDGEPVRSCMMFAFQANGCAVTTVEGLTRTEELHPLQRLMLERRGMQCGFCTPGMLMSILHYDGPIDRAHVTGYLSSQVCRCTGYASIVDAAMDYLTSRGPSTQESAV